MALQVPDERLVEKSVFAHDFMHQLLVVMLRQCLRILARVLQARHQRLRTRTDGYDKRDGAQAEAGAALLEVCGGGVSDSFGGSFRLAIEVVGTLQSGFSLKPACPPGGVGRWGSDGVVGVRRERLPGHECLEPPHECLSGSFHVGQVTCRETSAHPVLQVLISVCLCALRLSASLRRA